MAIPSFCRIYIQGYEGFDANHSSLLDKGTCAEILLLITLFYPIPKMGIRVLKQSLSVSDR